MKPGNARSTWKTAGARHGLRAVCCSAPLLMLLLSGCCWTAGKVDPHPVVCNRDVMSYHGPFQPGAGIAETYVVVCPDVLHVIIADHPELSGLRPIGVDGRLDLEPLGRPRVEGQT